MISLSGIQARASDAPDMTAPDRIEALATYLAMMGNREAKLSRAHVATVAEALRKIAREMPRDVRG